MTAAPTRAVPPPLRFLALVVGGWIAVRAVMLAPGWWTPADSVAGRAAGPAPALRHDPPLATPPRPALPAAAGNALAYPGEGRRQDVPPARLSVPAAAPPRPVLPDALPMLVAARAASGPVEPLNLPAPAAAPGRWSGSAWMLLRDERGRRTLAPGGTLGGSQMGARLLYRIGDGVALSARAYAPLRRTQGAEAAAGIDWRPSARLPFHILAERRQDLGGEGRSAFALTLYGGLSRTLPRGLRLEAEGQAGIVATRSRDLFADASARVSAPLGPVEAGAGAWGGAQPGAARLDAGPFLSWRLPAGRGNLRLQADWRFRLAGDAAPGSGPAFTLATDF